MTTAPSAAADAEADLSLSSTDEASSDAAQVSAEPLDGPNTLPGTELPEQGFEWGLKLGFELPLGDADGGHTVLGQQLRSGSLSGIGDFRIPIALDLGYRTAPDWWLGIEAGAGLGPAGDDCIEGATCEWSSLRLGAQAIYHLSPESSLDPWLGAVVGWEWLRGSVGLAVPFTGPNGEEQTGVVKARELLGGPQIALEGGLSNALDEHLTVGLFAAAAAGMYITDSFECPEELGCPNDGSVDDKALHLWLGLGVRGTHGP